MDANHTQRNPKKEEEEEQRQEHCAMKAPPDHYVCQKTAFLFEETSPTEECNDNEPIHKTEGHGFALGSFNEFTGYKSKDTEASSVSASYIASLELSENAETPRLRGAKEEGGEYEDRFQHEDAVVTLQKHEKGGTLTASTDTEVAIAEYSMLKHKGEDEKDGTELRDSLHEQSAIEDTALDLESKEDSSIEANIRADANLAAGLQRKLAQDEDTELELNRKEMSYIETEIQSDTEFAAALQKQLEAEDAALRSEESNEPCHDIEADTHFSVALQEMLEEEDDRQRRELEEKDAFMAVAMENGFLPGKDLVAEADAVYAAKLDRQLTMEAEKFREESRRADAEYAALLERELMIEAQKREEESRKADAEYAAQLEKKLAAEDEIWGKEEPEDDAEYAAQLEQKLAAEAEKFKEETRESDAAYAVQLERQLTVEIKKREEESVKVDAEYAAQLERQLTAELQKCEEETRKADADYAVELEQKFKAEERQRNEERCRADAEYAAEVESRLKQELEKRDEESRRADAEYAAELEKEVTDEIKKRKEESRQADAEYAAALERELAEEVEKRREESRRADAEFAAQLERELKEEVEKHKESYGEDAEYAAKLERERTEEVEKRKAESRRADEEYAAQVERELAEEVEKRKEESRKADAEYAAELEREMVEEVERRKEESRRADAELAARLDRELREQAERHREVSLSVDAEYAARVQRELEDQVEKRKKQEVIDMLEDCQKKAIGYVKSKAKRLHEQSINDLQLRVSALGYQPNDLDRCLEYIRDDAPIIIHFRKSTLSLLVKDTHYRSLFESSTSYPMTDVIARATWEREMFGNAYESCLPFDRPKYGCLNLTGDIMGVRAAIPFYGDFFMTLKSHVRYRTTFFGSDTGNFDNLCCLATNEYYAHILQSYTDAELRAVLGVSRISGAPSKAITVYKEVQIHGPVCLADDIQSLSVPGSKSTTSATLKFIVDEFQRNSGCNILWQQDLLSSP